MKDKSKTDLIKQSIKSIKESANKFDIPKVDISECLFINCKYYNVLV
jgi:hypothetical protein